MCSHTKREDDAMKYARGGMTSLDYLMEIQRLENELKKYDWISVKDRMPEQYTDVIVFIKGDTIAVDYVDENSDFYYYGEYVTHWMPLPTPPESESDAE